MNDLNVRTCVTRRGCVDGLVGISKRGRCMSNGVMTSRKVLDQFIHLYEDLVRHDGYGEIKVEVRILRQGEKEVVLSCGKQYRFIVNGRDLEVGYRAQRKDVMEALPQWFGEERRSGIEQRKQALGARNFKLERRIGGDRRRYHCAARPEM